MSEGICRLAPADMYRAQLDGLGTAMARCNFVVGLELFGFSLVTQGAFTIELLSELLAQYPIAEQRAKLLAEYPGTDLYSRKVFVAGSLEAASFEEFEDAIEGVLFWSCVANRRNDLVAVSIRKIFWDIVSKSLVDKPDVFLIHRPLQDSYFYDNSLFNLCFIVIAKNRGIVVSCSSSD